MVSIAPNQFRINAIVRAKRESMDNFLKIDLDIDHIEIVHGPPGFLQPTTKKLVVNFPLAKANKLKEGDRIECSIKKAFKGFYLIPDSLQLKET